MAQAKTALKDPVFADLAAASCKEEQKHQSDAQRYQEELAQTKDEFRRQVMSDLKKR